MLLRQTPLAADILANTFGTSNRVSGWWDFFPTTAELKKMAVTSTDTHYRKKVNYLCHLYCFAVNYLCHVNYFAYI